MDPFCHFMTCFTLFCLVYGYFAVMEIYYWNHDSDFSKRIYIALAIYPFFEGENENKILIHPKCRKTQKFLSRKMTCVIQNFIRKNKTY